MADQPEEDFSSLPLPDRIAHKVRNLLASQLPPLPSKCFGLHPVIELEGEKGRL